MQQPQEVLNPNISQTCSSNYKFTGYEYDSETGLYYAKARYYNPRLGRFMSVDPLGGDPRNPQSLNKYAYVRRRDMDPRDRQTAPPLPRYPCRQGQRLGACSAGSQGLVRYLALLGFVCLAAAAPIVTAQKPEPATRPAQTDLLPAGPFLFEPGTIHPTFMDAFGDRPVVRSPDGRLAVTVTGPRESYGAWVTIAPSAFPPSEGLSSRMAR
jgi:RHS repeat-associated protein